MPGGEVTAAAAEIATTVAETAAKAAPAVASASEGIAAAGVAGTAETAAESAVAATQEGTATMAGQAANAGLVASTEQTASIAGSGAGLTELAWGKPEPLGTTGAKVDSNQPVEPTAPDIAPSSTPEPTAEAGQQLEEAGLDTGGLKPGDRSYDAIIAEGDAKRALEAARKDSNTSPEELAKLEKEYADATGEREQAVADRDSATIDARTEEIKREVTDSVKQEFQGQIDKLTLSNTELRQAIQDMGRQVIEAIGKNNTEAFSEFKEYVDEKDPKKKEALWVKILVILAAVGKELLVGSGVSETVQQGTTPKRR